jgi:(p)ppGpp synthase/HD superfamily hydrolase
MSRDDADMPWSPDAYTQALHFAAHAHRGQTVPGSDMPYLAHVCNVAMEVMTAIASANDGVAHPDLAVQCGLLHDVIEDTDVTCEQIEAAFSDAVAQGVAALSKDDRLESKAEKMADSLRRIKNQPREIWMVKLADRITNLQPPPHYWKARKIRDYHAEAIVIHDALGSAHERLSNRLSIKIEDYAQYF